MHQEQFSRYQGSAFGQCSAVSPLGALGSMGQAQAHFERQLTGQPAKGASMFSEIATDVKSFIRDHRSILYFVVIALVLDHLLFKDAFKHRLQAILEKVIVKVEQKIDK